MKPVGLGLRLKIEFEGKRGYDSVINRFGRGRVERRKQVNTDISR
jgi:hypothetical protein